MARPDYLVLGALVVKELLTYDEANALAELYLSKDVEKPIPYSLAVGIDIAAEILTEVEDDSAIQALLHPQASEVIEDDIDARMVNDDLEYGDDEDDEDSPPSWWMNAYRDWSFDCD